MHATVPELQDAQLAAVYYAPRMFGDFCDFIRISPTRVLFVLLDVAGRLAQNQGTIAAAQATVRSAAHALLANEDTNEAHAMAEICLRLNLSILKAAGRACSCPAFAGCYNEGLRTVCYVNAGHTPGLLRHGKGLTELPATSLPLGLFSHLTSEAPTVAVEPGATFLVASRGVVEARRKSQEFGLDQVKDNLLRSTTDAAPNICATLLDRAQQFMSQNPTHNDMTVLAISRPVL
ncbi:MAG: PP2C family protein-serine/threonine phosphatase [Candidatus Angelobacter sp.]